MTNNLMHEVETYLNDRDMVVQILADPEEKTAIYLSVIDKHPAYWGALREMHYAYANGDPERSTRNFELDLIDEIVMIVQRNREIVEEAKKLQEHFGPISEEAQVSLSKMALYDSVTLKPGNSTPSSDQDQSLA
jgi:hypothetical protein